MQNDNTLGQTFQILEKQLNLTDVVKSIMTELPRLANIRERLKTVGDNLQGAVPLTAVRDESDETEQASLLGLLQDFRQDLRAEIDRLSTAVDRIEEVV